MPLFNPPPREIVGAAVILDLVEVDPETVQVFTSPDLDIEGAIDIPLDGAVEII
jgi:hypothetical protein